MNIGNFVSKFLKTSLVNRSLKVLFIRVLGVLLFFCLSMFLTNFYSPELVGKYDFSRSLIMVIGGICLLGTNQSIIYYSGILKSQNSSGSLKVIYFRMTKIIVLVSLFFFGLIILINDEMFNTYFNKSDAAELIFKVIITLSFFGMTMLNIDMLRALNKTMLSELFRNIFRYLPFLIIVILLSINDLFDYLIDAYLWSFVFLAILSSFFIFHFLKQQDEPDTFKEVGYKKILNQSYPMAISALSYFLMQSIDVLLLSKYHTFETVAYYSVAVKLATVTALALQSVNIIVAPKIAEIYSNNDRGALNKLVRNSSRLIFAMSLPTLLTLAIFSNFALSLFGEGYTQGRTSLLILLFGQLFNSLCGPVAIYLNMTGKQNKLQKILIFGFLMNLILNLIFIPEYGMLGASISTALSMVAWNIIATFYVYKKDKLKTFLS